MEAEGNAQNVQITEEKTEKRKVRIAVAGCSHGEMEKIYEVTELIEKENGYKFDLLICCGDYQAVRNYGDLHHLHVPFKYRQLRTFYKYYNGEKKAPILTLFIGGNHEASGYLTELPNGGWVAPNIYYMGFANVVKFAGLRIAGLSGIFNQRQFNFAHYERPPFSNESEKISVYHVRNVDVFRLKQLRPADADKESNPIDIMVSHDWPSGIADFGDLNGLLKMKPYFREDHESGKLGNPATMNLLYEIRPRYWLSAHLHVAFAALVPHKPSIDGKRPKPTRFLSLDKPIPNRKFLQALEIEVDDDAEFKLSYDEEWLAVLRNTDEYTYALKKPLTIPDPNSTRKDYRATEDEINYIKSLGDLTIKPEWFRQTAPPLMNAEGSFQNSTSSAYYRNPQTTEFCNMIGIKDLNKMLAENDESNVGIGYYETNKGEILQQNSEEFGDSDFIIDGNQECSEAKKPRMDDNPDEIALE